MPFADDVRKYTFASLDNLISKKGERITQHPYIPTEVQIQAMDQFVDAMDLMDAGEKDENGCIHFSWGCLLLLILPSPRTIKFRDRQPWFDTLQSYNPAVHRVKQALFHCAVVSDISANPLPPPHPELTKYFEPPRRVLKRAKNATEECRREFKVKQGKFYFLSTLSSCEMLFISPQENRKNT
jgi:ATP-dependent DNA helicase 2 subunit 2